MPELGAGGPQQPVAARDVALADLTDPQAVLAAAREFDQRGREGFLDKYGFRPARGFFVLIDGKQYDAKALAGVAHLHQHGTLLTRDMFSGGDSTVARRLEHLGFEVTKPNRLPDWTTDELMLALDLYLRTRERIAYSASTQIVTDLSAELRALRIFGDETRADPRFRNPAGVALKPTQPLLD
ncbi:hypothetical protein GCM10025868_27370 [Angustibacter aerolatus]|uniref:ScoMcrA-like N-terminal head domain-containing protein n=1 Tax=Angustibacter aerolatus TaxID=1162965 RepID=A0ABQ6JIA6_9ACTN|nr:hypothetical protein GCM10025868_27370 [Angustibacter aerolatus]